ncbi:2-oxo acid dehydrogenase subunit E2 [Nocardia sp. NBC_01503]|uniref:2-oxo acid dehydrogenase subunit E2 n=1 Tax=Nocardia sp. NBC_01503 TaxID=2975997 RepID=UPI002E7B6B7F|nr:2-oxo acid dehydrogenase subunit E2 [Nocardia sp. NBC_01503]WTL31058.1 2-oxo acid dehydrogenase subunit E2 [Nocardia sp. NBC_01503]
MPEFRMPSLGADMTEGTLLTWLVHPGDSVHAGDVVAEVDTAKAAIEVECFDDGVIGELLVPEGVTVPVGTPLATITAVAAAGDTGSAAEIPTGPAKVTEAVKVAEAAEVAAAAEGERAAEIPEVGEVAAATVGTGVADRPSRRRKRAIRAATRAEAPPEAAPVRAAASLPTAESPNARTLPFAAGAQHTGVRATPLVRRLAAEAGIDLDTVHGSAPGGRIVRSDVEHAATERAGAIERPEGMIHNTGEEFAVPVPASRTADRIVSDDVARQQQTPSDALAHASDKTGRASGYARRLAVDLGVDLAAVGGSGIDGAVRAADVRAAAATVAQRRESSTEVAPALGSRTVAPEPAPTERVVSAASSRAERVAELPPRDPVAMRRAIAAAMTRSKQTVPHYYLSSTVDMDAALRWLRETNRRAPVAERLLPAALLLTATARAAKAVPEMNGYWVDERFQPASVVHLGMVVSLRGGGIIVPTIPDADTLAPTAMMAALRGVAERTRTLRLRAADTTPATITVTNLGDLGADSVFGVIAAPQVAIVGFGAISERPCAVDGLLGVRAQVTATLSADHRASDGAVGARFLHTLSDLLQHPEEL